MPDNNTGFVGPVKTVLTSSDPVEAALADALAKATIAGAFDAVKSLADELAARRRARTGVIDLEAVRRERGAR